eukprot:gene16344-18530_t
MRRGNIDRVDKKYQPLVDVLVNDCDWSWTKTAILENGLPLARPDITNYQVFILCKLVAGDLKVGLETKRLRLSPTEQIDEVWHQHLLRPVSYYEMCRKVYEAKQKLSLDVKDEDVHVDVEGKASVLDCIIDHTPESSNDTEEMKYERYKVTRSYLLKVCPSYVFTHHPLDRLDPLKDDLSETFESLFLADNVEATMKTENSEVAVLTAEASVAEDVEGSLFTVKIKTLAGVEQEVPNVHGSMKVIDLMRRYEEMAGIPVDQQRYIFNGQPLNEEDRLSEYNIENNSVVHIVLRLRC